MTPTIVKASPEDHERLTEISFRSKGYWEYPEEYLEIWRDELTITPDYIEDNTVYLARIENEIVGYYSITENPEDFWAGKVFVQKGYWLEHIFILPDNIRKGLGRQLMLHAMDIASEMGVQNLHIFADPNSQGFYLKLGARYIGERPSNIKSRTVSLFELKID